uniref:Uncharacterized protein n=1 Tax=Pristionchus pacificus TaxID=54126 RepID=A0A2A6CFK1_PRIPA|eukprot:PDM76982.1 hypothetical protein PRIPAC_42377 [Pristionchus pacificus]
MRYAQDSANPRLIAAVPWLLSAQYHDRTAPALRPQYVSRILHHPSHTPPLHQSPECSFPAESRCPIEHSVWYCT